MIGYAFEKWYFDLAAEGTRILGYLGAVELCGLRGARLTVVAMHPGRGAAWAETRAVRLEAGSSPTRAVTAQGTLALGDRAGRIAFDLAGLSVDLELTLHDAGPLPGLAIQGGGARSELAWRPVALRAHATGRIVRAGERIELVRSPAYLDHLRSTIAPRAVPVRTLHWGHLDADELALTYTVIEGARASERWSTLVLSERDRITALPVELRELPAAGPGDGGVLPPAIALTGSADGLSVAIEIEPRSLALATEFIDEGAGFGRLGARALSWVALHPRAVKFFAVGGGRIERSGRARDLGGAPVFAERVTFTP